jgi:hypothetical protein
MLEAFIVACCLGVPVALGVVATFRKGKKEQEATMSSQDIGKRHRE